MVFPRFGGGGGGNGSVLSMCMQVNLDFPWTLFSPARAQPLYGAGRKERLGTGLVNRFMDQP